MSNTKAHAGCHASPQTKTTAVDAKKRAGQPIGMVSYGLA
jgi:hypothetical protein